MTDSNQRPMGVRLFLLAFLTLYLELALIRTTAAEVLYLGYFANFVLISVFLGIGLGFLSAERRFSLFRMLPVGILGLLGFIVATRIDVSDLRHNMGQLFFGHAGSSVKIPLAVCLLVIFVMTVLLFAALAQETGRCFKHFKPLTAYSIDIGGSLAGIVAFTLHSYLGGSPPQWFILGFAVILLLTPRKPLDLATAAVSGVAVVALLLASAPDHYTRWSPYQRIEVAPMNQGHHLLANGIGHQTMLPVGQKEPIYDFPYRDVLRERDGRQYERALIVGAGSGTDTSYALHYGVEHVDAVEIDPQILEAGRRFHPAQPYADERVDTYVTDGRAFMERTENRYDLIIFALPDSLASYSNLSNIRLESFLFTVESFERAARLLTDDGVLVLYNYYRRQWLVDKLAGMLEEVFGHSPLVREYSGEDSGMLVALAIGPQLEGEPRMPSPLASATDDWPFLYMHTPYLPPMYGGIIALFAVSGLLGVALTGRARLGDVRRNGHFLLMGIAFLLLETKSIIEFSLLFGATWLVNSLVFFAILSSVLAANLMVSKLNLRSPMWPFLLLLVTLGIQIVLRPNDLLGIEGTALRYAVSSLVFFSPIFFANLLFGILFRDVTHSATAFGWNLLGTMMGGALEYTSLAVGYQSLSVLVAALYIACAAWAYLVARRVPQAVAAPA